MLSHRRLVGRINELEDLGNLFADPSARVITVEGESGSGKTALAIAALEQLAQTTNRKVVSIFLARAGQVAGLEDWLIAELAGKLLGTVPANATSLELRRLITESAATTDLIVLLDNAESLSDDWLLGFIGDWLVYVSSAKLVVTSTHSLALEKSEYRTYLLRGLRPEEEEAVLSFLGADLRARFAASSLLSAAKRLSNLPQKLLYLRWINPENDLQLGDVVTELSQNTASSALVSGIRRQSRSFIGHYLALGHVRALLFEEGLLAALWDSLGGGSTAAYVAVRDELVKEGLLARVSEGGKSAFRINPGVHLHLEKQLASSLGTLQLPHVDYFLAEYFRRHFEGATGELQSLGHYIYHSARCGNLPIAVEYVLSDSRIEALRGRGLTVALRRTLLMLHEQLDAEHEPALKAVWGEGDLLMAKCRTILELARCHCDLSEYEECLNAIDGLVEAVSSRNSSSAMTELMRRVNVLRGISLGCLGRLEECIRSYVAVVSDALDGGPLNMGAIEALGYAAMVVGYLDMNRALSLGEKSLYLAMRLGDNLTLAKNKCSFGQTLLFAHRFTEAVEVLATAEAWCRGSREDPGDRRELGRVLVPVVLATMATRGGDAALALADEAVEINSEVGDRRRQARAVIARALAIMSAGNREKGFVLLNEGMEQLYASQDWLNLVVTSFTCGYVLRNTTAEELLTAAAKSTEGWANVLKSRLGSGLARTLATFWDVHYLPFLRSAGI